MIRRAFVLAVVCLSAANTTLAQTKERIGRFVVDIRGASAGLPPATGWTPVVPAGTIVPARALGLEAGAHVYVARVRGATLGLGGAWLVARGTTTPATPAPAGPASPAILIPRVTTKLVSAVPQLSLNFGHSLGWSYLSAGLGRTRVTSAATFTGNAAGSVPLDSGWTKTLNFGGGARWIITDHLGAGFDLRWHKVSIVPASAAHPGAPRASLVTAGVGMVVK